MRILKVLSVLLLNISVCSFLASAAEKDTSKKDSAFSKTVNIKSLGAKGDNRTDDTAIFKNAIDKISSNTATIEISEGIFVVDKITVPENIALRFCNGGKISVAKNGSLEINGTIDAGIGELFVGEGNVKGQLKNACVYPQWFGAKADGKNDDAPAIQKAADLAKFSSGKTLFIPAGRYLIEKNIDISCSVESRGILVKNIEVDESKSKMTYSYSFTPSHQLKNNPRIFFKPDVPRISLAPEYFYGIKKNDFKVGKFENIPLADKPEEKINLEEGGTLTFFCSDFFTSRNNGYGDQWYEKNDQCQIVSPRGDVFPEFCFSYDAFPNVPDWSAEKVYKKGDYCKYGNKIFKASYHSGPGTFFDDKHKGKTEIGAFSPEKGNIYKFKDKDGKDSSLNIWVELKMTVSYTPPQIPLTVNNFVVEIYLKDSDGKAKRIDDSGSVFISRSNMTFNNMSISCKSRQATLASLCGISTCSKIVFNNCTFSGATYHGLGYNILNSNVSNITFNNCTSVNCRDAIAGRHGKNITVNGGYYFSIDDHYGKNYTIRDAVIQGISTDIPGYCSPKSDLEKWSFTPRAAFIFGGGDIYIENCRVYNTKNILEMRGGEADMDDSRITMKNIVVKNNSDVCVLAHGINKDFDYAHKLQMPRQVVIENIKINEPYKLSFYIELLQEDLKYNEIYIRNCGPFRNFKVYADAVTFVDCSFKDSVFNVSPGTLCNFSNCIFSGKVTGLTSKNIGRNFGNIKAKGSEISFPLKYINANNYEE